MMTIEDLDSETKVIKAFGGEDTESRAFSQEAGRLFRHDMRVARHRALSRSAAEALNSRPAGHQAHPDKNRLPSLWERLGSSCPAEAWGTVFGIAGDRGEYMDGYSPSAMADISRS